MEEENILEEFAKGTQFSSINQPAKNGRTKGQKNRATIYRECLALIAAGNDKDPTLSPLHKMIIALMYKANEGHIYAIREIMTGLYGKAPAEVEPEIPQEKFKVDYTKLSREKLNLLAEIYKEASVEINNNED